MSVPAKLERIKAKCQELGFDMASDQKAGALLRILAASKPGGRFLELGTGIGSSLCWMLEGMDPRSEIISVDNDQGLIDAVRSILGGDPRLELVCQDGQGWIESYSGELFDLIFADTWPGKYFYLEQTLDLLKPGGFYIIDDMLPQPNWPAGHDKKATELIELLDRHNRLVTARLDWSTGVMVCTKKITNGV